MIYELGTMVTDKATKLKGMLTHLRIHTGRECVYLFQPHGLNPETGHPLKTLMVSGDRIGGGKQVDDSFIPYDVLGTEVEDTASGFKGTAVSLTVHLSGCVHVTIQPAAKVKRTNEAVEELDIDIRRCKGPKVPKLTKAERKRDESDKPSPAPSEGFKRLARI